MTQAMALEESHDDWLQDAVATIISIAGGGSSFSADDLHKEMGRRAPHPNLPGIAFTTAKRLGYIEHDGWAISTSKSRKNGSLRTWHGTQKSKRQDIWKEAAA